MEIQGRLLVDGGLADNLPVDAVRTMNPEVVIAVDSSARLEKKERLTTALDILSQAVSIEVRRQCGKQAALADLTITPDTSEFSFTGFPSMKGIIAKGEEAARAALPRIREIMRPRSTPPDERFRITGLTVRGNRLIPGGVIRDTMSKILQPGEVTAGEIRSAMADVFNLGYFSEVSADLVKQGTGYGAVLAVEENPVVKAVVISGNTLIPSGEIMASLGWQPGSPLNVTRLSQELERITGEYRNRGYLLAHVAHAGMKPDNSTLEIVIYEGRVDSIRLTGQEKTEPSLIRREIKTRSGKALNLGALGNDIEHLYALDYFDSVTVDLAKSPQGGIDLTFKIKEKPTTKVRLGLRYDLEDRFTGLTDIVFDNLTGRGFKLYLNTRYGNYTDITLGYYSPVFLRSYFVHTIQLFYRDRNYFLYEDKRRVNELDVTRIGGEVAFGYQWFRFGDTYLRYRYTTDRTSEALGLAPAENVIHIGSMAFVSTADTRDSSAFAHRGVLFKGSYETAQPSFGSTHRFTKTSAYLQANIPLAERHTLILEGSAGIGSGNFPYQEKFGIGGADYLISYPLMGYQRREFVGPNELGFSAAYLLRIAEYQLKAVKAVYLSMTGQAANVWDNTDSISVRDLRSGAGIGLAADTIIGPVRLDFGAGEQHRYMVYFSAGFDF